MTPRTIAVRARISAWIRRSWWARRGDPAVAAAPHPGSGAGDRAAGAAVEGRREPFGETAWEDDLAASRTTLEAVRSATSACLAADEQPVVLASDCAVALATAPALASVRPDVRVLWLDAHSDYDTPETSSYSFLGCMSLAGAVGAWRTVLADPLPPERVVLCGAPAGPGDFDATAQAAAEASPITVVPLDGRERAALGDAPVYVHLDPDVLDPAVNPVPYARPGGIALAGLHGLLAAVAARGPVAGVEVSAFHTSDDPAARAALGAELATAVRLLLDGAPASARPARG